MSFVFQCTEKHPRLPRRRLDCPLDHSIALARSNRRVLDNVPPVRHFREGAQLRAKSRNTFRDVGTGRLPGHMMILDVLSLSTRTAIVF